MLVPLNWLREYVDCDLEPAQIAEKFTVAGLEVEGVNTVGPAMPDIVIGHIKSIEKHPNADKLVVCQVDVGDGTDRCIVCGAKNMKVGDKVPTALVGAEMPGGFCIQRRPLRGVKSEGMMCSATELEIGDDASGLLILPDDAPVGQRFDQYAGLDQIVLDISLTPNRPDCACMIGMARETAALTDATLRQPVIELADDGPPVGQMTSVSIEDNDLCPRYAARVITNVSIGPSPQWMIDKLRAAGLRSINNVVDATNYVLIEMGHPLHAFDYDKLAENRIVVRRAQTGESITTIDGVDRNLDPEMLVIADANTPVALAGIMGGINSEISDTTNTVLLESAFFLPTSIRKTSKSLGIMTEASYRFERGADIELVPKALDRCAQLIAELANGTVCAGIIDAYPKPAERKTITLRPERVQKLLGCEIDPDEMVRILTKLEFVVHKTDNAFSVEVPTRRVDVSMETDLIEEIGRINGLDKLPVRSRVKRPAPVLLNSRKHARRNSLRNLMTAAGFSETINYSFISTDLATRSGFPEQAEQMIPIRNPLSREQGAMRMSLLPGLLNVAGANYRRGRQDCAIFEIGRVFLPDPQAELPVENERIACLATGLDTPQSWTQTSVPTDIFTLKGIIETIGEHHNINNLTFTDTDHPAYADDTGFHIHSENAAISGSLGQVHPDIARRFDIDQPVFVCELDIDQLLTAEIPDRTYTKLSPFPPAYRDLAIIVDDNVPAGLINDTIRAEAGESLSDIKLFDLYKGKQIPDGKKSLAYSLTFINNERTLTDSETDTIISRILKQLAKQHGAELRAQ
ncbi:MAG: phenylalanine--tRNA ligase subunit beta [Candidatus Hydrogenedentes bacterium]|nr:phenylalanine--tRNA ligase subunit beta [Candidatus Hydrogenedentota bacterium]